MRADPTGVEVWMARRAQLNHDFLQNRVLGAVRAALSAPGTERTASLGRVFETFVARRSEFASLLDAATVALSPSSLLRDQIDGRLPAPDRAWLAAFVDQEFLALSDMPSQLERARVLLDTAAAAARNYRDGAGSTEELEASLQRLSEAISRLPASPVAATETMFRGDR
jgi:hypothetical protein